MKFITVIAVIPTLIFYFSQATPLFVFLNLFKGIMCVSAEVALPFFSLTFI